MNARIGLSRIAASLSWGLLAIVSPQVQAVSEVPDEQTSDALMRIDITAPAVDDTWRETPTSVSVVDNEHVDGAQDLSLDQSLQRVPGVFAQNRFNFAQGLRLSIRGFGARGNFGVRGVRVLLDGVPLTLPDGQTELDALDLGLTERVEVIRGPASTLYGNGAGGVLSVHTREAPENRHALVDVSAGDFGFSRVRAEAGGSLGSVRTLGAVNATRLDGFRSNSQVNSEIYTGKLALPFSTGTLNVNFNGLEIDAQDPGALNLSQVRADRSRAAPNNLIFDGGESISQQRVSLLWQGQAGARRDYSLSAYVGQREFDNRLPFEESGQVDFERVFGGVQARTTLRAIWLGLAQQVTGGFNLEAQQDDRSRFDNLNGVRGNRRLQQDENATGWGVFLHNDIALTRRLSAGLGLRYDRIRLSVDDRFQSDGDDSGARDLDNVSYSAGLSFEFTPQNNIYARVATSFETPTSSELANPNGGGFNAGLEPVEAVNYELGIKGERSRLRYELVVFHISLQDELIAFELPGESGRSFFRNAGESHRNGVELSTDWQFQPHWRASAAYTYADYEFERFTRDGMNFSGNKTPGIPEHVFFGELAYERERYYARLNTNVIGQQFADDANTTRISGYGLLNARMGINLKDGAWRVQPYLGIDNILNKDYNDNVRINAFGGRFYEPAPGRYIYAGIRAALD